MLFSDNKQASTEEQTDATGPNKSVLGGVFYYTNMIVDLQRLYALTST